MVEHSHITLVLLCSTAAPMTVKLLKLLYMPSTCRYSNGGQKSVIATALTDLRCKVLVQPVMLRGLKSDHDQHRTQRVQSVTCSSITGSAVVRNV